MRIAKILSLFAAPIVGWALFSSAAYAITVSPVIVDHEVANGMRVSGRMMITNDSKAPQTYYVSVQSFIAVGENGEQQYLDEADLKGLPSWFRFNQESYQLAPGETVEVPYSIYAPQDAEPGGHYATVFFSTNPEAANDRTAINLAAKTGIVFLVKVGGDVKESASIESFTANQSVYSHLPALMSLRIRNTGSVHFRPIGTLTVRNMWGGIVARVPANPKKSAVLPNSIRRLDTWWTKTTDLAEGGFISGLTNEWKNFALGRYTATVDVKYGSQNTPLEARTISFWVLPWRMGLILLALLAILFLLMRLYNKMIISSALKQSRRR
ncbi:MAG: hypothetical protein PHC70_04440 [Patescibacteria group bacterium]|nr:hypothetical protein [Patescibacteria group bacterium]